MTEAYDSVGSVQVRSLPERLEIGNAIQGAKDVSENKQHAPPDDAGKEQYLIDGGWIQNGRGWWHPPSCLASWPLDQAYLMAKEDERKGLRMSKEEVEAYLRDG
jgi:hypothetical protein